MTTINAIGLVFDEVTRARELHKWPDDVIHQAAIVAEEAGELVQAVNNFYHHGGDYELAKKEAIQVAATAIRFLVGS